jgi:hypothetical protein
MDEKLIRQRQERLAQKREQAITIVHDCEFELDVLAEQLDRLAMRQPTMLSGDLLGGLFGRRKRRRIIP